VPSCNICGLVAEYTAKGAKTVLPSKAIAKLDFRLVPDMIPEMQFERLKKHLQQQGYGNLKVDGRNGSGTNMEIKFLDVEPQQGRQ
jgi:acetylornithine deacetylase/succinyl-diaminopimelate desuccinylase-like protein